MIPKIIHYCWFSKYEKDEMTKRCLESFRKNLPDYVIHEWSEITFDVFATEWTKIAWERKDYYALNEYIRWYVLEKYGGIFLDADVEVLRNMDDLLRYRGFLAYETRQDICPRLGCGFEVHHPIPQAILKKYDICAYLFPELVGQHEFGITKEVRDVMENKFFYHDVEEAKRRDGVLCLSKEYFGAADWLNRVPMLSDKAYVIHHNTLPWQPNDIELFQSKRPICIFFQNYCGEAISSVGGWIQELIKNNFIVWVSTLFEEEADKLDAEDTACQQIGVAHIRHLLHLSTGAYENITDNDILNFAKGLVTECNRRDDRVVYYFPTGIDNAGAKIIHRIGEHMENSSLSHPLYHIYYYKSAYYSHPFGEQRAKLQFTPSAEQWAQKFQTLLHYRERGEILQKSVGEENGTELFFQ